MGPSYMMKKAFRCESLIRGGGNELIIGVTFFNDLYMNLDLDNSRIGFRVRPGGYIYQEQQGATKIVVGAALVVTLLTLMLF
mmetsp:Transcript_483/g.949  ORF Transcript_483/g.949 Transcript_483/m.949 type:complete len:82 (-) Transcript_483:70-315(-)